jgi:ankyrin repeat protein
MAIGRWGRACLGSMLLVASVGAAGRETRIVDVVKAGDRQALRALLVASVPVNAPEIDGTTALHWAVRADDLEVTRLLLHAGASAGASNRYGVTPLSLAATNGNAAIIEALIKAGADPNARTLGAGETALMTAARTGRADAVKVLLAAGAEVDVREKWLGENALMWAAAENHAATVAVLLSGRADPDARSNVSSFPRAKTPLTVLPRGGWTPLMYAARQGAFDAAKVLVDGRADLNLRDPDGATALILAIINAHYDLAALLIDKGADPNIADMTGTTALFAATDMHTLPAVFGLPDQKPSDNLDSLDIVKSLLAHGANPDLELRGPMLQRLHTPGDPILGMGATAFMRAARGGDLPLMRVLLDAGANPAKTLRNHTTALLIAAGLGWRAGDANLNTRDHGTQDDAIEAMKLCLQLGADIHATTDNGDTVLHAAAGRGDAVKIVQFLANSGADPDATNTRGQTPLDVALARKGQDGASAVSPETVALLRRLTSGEKSANRP